MPKQSAPRSTASPRESLEIEVVVEHHGLDSQPCGKVDESEALDLAATGRRVAQEHRVTRWTSRSCTNVDAVEILYQSGTRARHRRREKQHDDHDLDTNPLGAVDASGDRGGDDSESRRDYDEADERRRGIRSVTAHHPPAPRSATPTERDQDCSGIAKQEAGDHDEDTEKASRHATAASRGRSDILVNTIHPPSNCPRISRRPTACSRRLTSVEIPRVSRSSAVREQRRTTITNSAVAAHQYTPRRVATSVAWVGARRRPAGRGMLRRRNGRQRGLHHRLVRRRDDDTAGVGAMRHDRDQTVRGA